LNEIKNSNPGGWQVNKWMAPGWRSGPFFFWNNFIIIDLYWVVADYLLNP